MIQAASAPCVVAHSYGIIMHHRLAWWLVEFPELDAAPVRARKLSGKLTAGMTDWLRAETGDPGLAADVAALNPESRCWSGEFSTVPTMGGADLFDIDAHPWGSEPGELETRLARTMIDATLRPVPSGFVSVFTALPPENQPVLAIRLSGYTCATFDLLTARHMPTYRPRSPWRDISGDAVSDSGSDIIGWCAAEDWIRPT
ncbi:hypothetical protein [Novosphingobium pentaromativorans]|uniref:Uncharacterized protein n=1 Tax=Novosphingobium pentaromativorans US6-1 TaxID=1088721 RepID=G6EJX7_9SPHN|nr:hypothetical protein [Novosphingobium pentaromativorans]AIT82537.1 hypothetical protein JI59_24005 [Novosphingobium pentaromativorans US6-1]EHJ58379.1 hypothetical protein NSU_4648 [Novosphingobium pentaromativorans US6-1]